MPSSRNTKPSTLIKVMLDSGAYSAWTHSKTIPIKDYIKFVKDCEQYLDIYVNLDVIPGSIEKVRTMEDVAISAEASYRNLQIMKDAGLKPLPVFHQQESFRWLEKMLKDGEDYIGISSAKNQPNIVQERWLDEFFSVVTDGKGAPLVKVHGFGSAHVDILQRHPYYSVDSAGWRIAAAYGKMYVPCLKPDGKGWNYLATPELVTMSANFQESKHSQQRQHTQPEYHGPMHLEAIARWLEQEVGVSIGMARYSDRIRYRALAVYYQEVANAIQRVRFVDRAGRLADRAELQVQELLARRKAVDIPSLKFIFSTAYDLDNCTALLEADANHHLLSYYEIRNRPEVLEPYAMRGQVVSTRPPVGVQTDWKNRRYRSHRGRSLAKRVFDASKKEQSNAAG